MENKVRLDSDGLSLPKDLVGKPLCLVDAPVDLRFHLVLIFFIFMSCIIPREGPFNSGTCFPAKYHLHKIAPADPFPQGHAIHTKDDATAIPSCSVILYMKKSEARTIGLNKQDP
jgi:hypothetical protein